MDLQLKGKRALVSASSSGIGYAIAVKLAQEGAEVILNGRTEQTVQQALDKAKLDASGGTFLSLVADIGSAEGAAKAISEYPEVDILVNNLGIYWASDFDQTSDEDWSRIFPSSTVGGPFWAQRQSGIRTKPRFEPR